MSIAGVPAPGHCYVQHATKDRGIQDVQVQIYTRYMSTRYMGARMHLAGAGGVAEAPAHTSSCAGIQTSSMKSFGAAVLLKDASQRASCSLQRVHRLGCEVLQTLRSLRL